MADVFEVVGKVDSIVGRARIFCGNGDFRMTTLGRGDSLGQKPWETIAIVYGSNMLPCWIRCGRDQDGEAD